MAKMTGGYAPWTVVLSGGPPQRVKTFGTARNRVDSELEAMLMRANAYGYSAEYKELIHVARERVRRTGETDIIKEALMIEVPYGPEPDDPIVRIRFYHDPKGTR